MKSKSNTTSTSSVSELYAIQLENSEPSHYTRIPNILGHLTYDKVNPKTGKITVKRLSAAAKVLYMELKCTAGERGKCWKNRNTLAKDCALSAGTITNAKKELTQSFHQLEGGSLIRIEEKKKATIKDNSVKNKTDYHEITILNIWHFNNAYMAVKNALKEEARSPNDSAHEARSPNDIAPQGARSPGDTNKNIYNKTHMSKEQQPTADADSVRSLKKEKNMFPSDSEESRAIRWLVHQGYKEKEAAKFMEEYTLQDLIIAKDYVARQHAKKTQQNGKIENFCAYFAAALKGKYGHKPKK